MVTRFLLAFLVLFCLLPHLSAQTYDTSNSSCPEIFECQNLGRMRFPFANFLQPDCGLCMVDCTFQPSPSIRLSRYSTQYFQARSPSRSNFIKLHDPLLKEHLQNSSCNLFFHTISLPNSPSISFTIKINLTLFRCSKDPKRLGPGVEDNFQRNQYRNNKSCEDFDIYYRNPKYHRYDNQREPPLGCSSVHLPMLSWENITEETELIKMLTADFDLEWHVSNRCDKCHREEGRCETTVTNEFNCVNAKIRFHSAAKGNRKWKTILLLTAAPIGGIVLLLILGFLFKLFPICDWMGCWKSVKEDRDLEAFLKKHGSIAPKRYHYFDVKKMINSFNTKLGQGGYGSVYKGKLQDGSLVAVKILKECKGNGEEFVNEVASISRTSHLNIVTLLGFCAQGQKKALIYEFMSNGSLEKYIYGGKSSVDRQLGWPVLYKVAVGIARGLEYLHRGCNTKILHFDIKPHNILLDENFVPKISDFGLAKLCPGNESILSKLTARGTIGYIAPEIVCKSIGAVSHKSDVYSYGMMVLEMVGGRKNFDVGFGHTSELYFPQWIYTRLDQGEELGLFGIMNEEENKQARKMLIVSLWCIQTNPTIRPTIASVLQMLEGPLEALQMPPKFFFHSPSIESSQGSTTLGDVS